jgi:hypothetical protein
MLLLFWVLLLKYHLGILCKPAVNAIFAAICHNFNRLANAKIYIILIINNYQMKSFSCAWAGAGEGRFPQRFRRFPRND